MIQWSCPCESHDGKSLLHCRSGGRITNFDIAYLVKYRMYDLDDAHMIGLNLRYRPSSLEQLLERKIGRTSWTDADAFVLGPVPGQASCIDCAVRV